MDIRESWNALPAGARAALEEQWAGLASGGLPCGSSIVDAAGVVVARGRNHAYDPVTGEHRLERSRIAHAELNTLAQLDTDIDSSQLTLFTTEHPCSMCAAALSFTGIGRVVYIADDPSDDATAQQVSATRGGVIYQRLGSVEWAIVATIMFLYVGAELRGAADGNLVAATAQNPALGALVLAEVTSGELGVAARNGVALPDAFAKVWELFS